MPKRLYIAKSALFVIFNFFLVFSFGFSVNADVDILHEFAGGAGGGKWSQDSLTLSGDTLYGMTNVGGAADKGVIFSMATNGGGYTNLREFGGGAGDGARPQGSLTLSGTTLYGMTNVGGAADKGVIFSMATNGGSYTNLREFAGGAGDGQKPYGSLTLSGDTLYGMANVGGAANKGVIFSMGTGGGSYTNLREFAGGAGDGDSPYGSLTLSGNTLYGMTSYGGAANKGVTFSIGTDGGSYTNLHEFAGGAGDGENPRGSLTLSGDTLYGMTYLGGATNKGVTFSIGTDGANYTNLHEFAGGAGDGENPLLGSLILSGSTLYGMTGWGGANNKGVTFSMATNGDDYTNLHEFAGYPGDGQNPYGSLILSGDGNTVYGMTRLGGANDYGVIFSAAVPEPSTYALFGIGLFGLIIGWLRKQRRTKLQPARL